MYYDVQVASSDMTVVPSFVKIGLLVQKSILGGLCAHACTHTHTHTQHGDLMTLLFPIRKESRARNYLNKSCIVFLRFIATLEILYLSLRATGAASSSQIFT
jgi:hypothetical protein